MKFALWLRPALILFLPAFLIFASPVAAEPEGDVNADGVINLTDFGLIADQILGRKSLTGDLLARTDTNDDGRRDVADLVWVLNHRSSLNYGISTNANPVAAGQIVLVTLTATNLTTQTLTQLTLNFTIPPYADYGVFNPGETRAVNVGTLQLGATSTITFPLTIRSGGLAPPQGTLLALNSWATSAEGYRTDAIATLTVNNSPALTVGLRADFNPVEPRQTLRYTLHFGNRDIVTIPDATLRMPVPFGVTASDVEDGGVLTLGEAVWNLGPLAAGQTGQVHLRTVVDNILKEGELIQAEAILEAGGEVAHATLGTAILNNVPLKFEINTSADPVAAGQIVNVTVSAANEGTQAIDGLTLNLTIPQYADYGVFNPGETIAWNVGALPAGRNVTETIPLTIRTGVNAPPDGAILHLAGWATTTQQHHAETSRNLTVDNAPSLEVGLINDRNPAEAGQPLAYTLHFANQGITSIDGGTLRMAVPLGIVMPRVDGGGTIADGWAAWDLGTLTAGENGQVHLSGLVDSALQQGDLIRAEVTLQAGAESAHATLATTVRSFTPLVFNLNASADPVRPGQIVQITLTATNRGAQALSGVTLNLLIPEFADYGTFNPSETFTSNVGALSAGRTASVTIPLLIRSGVNAPPSGAILHLAASAETAQGDRSDLARSLTADSARALNVGLATDVNPAEPGTPLDFTIHYGNYGIDSIPGVTARMAVPVGIDSPAADAGGVVADGWATWDLGTLTAGQSGQLHLRGVVSGGLGSGELIRAQAVLESPADSAYSSLATSVRAPQALVFDVSANADPVHPGQIVHVTLTATNRGAQALSDVNLRFMVPEYADYGVYGPGETFPWDVPALAAGRSVTETFPLAIRSAGNAPPAGLIIHANAWATSAQGDRADLARDFAVDATPTLDVGLSGDLNPAAPGGPLEFSIHYGNYGIQNAPGATLRMEVPAGIGAAIADDGGVITDGWATWDLGALAAGQSGWVRLRGEVDAGLANGELIRARTTLASGAESARSAIATVLQNPPYPLDFDLTTHADPVRPGRIVHVTMTVSNTGDQALNAVTLRFLIPEYADYGVYGPGEVYTLSPVVLNAGQNYAVTFPLTVRTSTIAPPNGTVLRLNAWATSAQGYRADLKRDLVVNTAPTLQVGMTADRNPVAPAQTLEYTLQFGNSDGAAITSPTLRMAVPAGLDSPQADGGGIIEDGVAVWNLADLAAGGSGAVHLTGVVENLHDGALIRAAAELSGGGRRAATAETTFVQSAPALFFEVTADANPVVAAQTVNVTLKATNESGQTMDGVILRLLIPEYADFGIYNPGEVYATSAVSLAAGANTMVTIPLKIRGAALAPPAGSLPHLSAWAESTQGYRSDLACDIRVTVP